MKRLLSITLSIILCLSVLTGCGSKETTDSNSTIDTVTTDENDITVNYDLTIPDYSEYFELGQYKGLEYYLNDDLYTVTDEIVTAVTAQNLYIDPIDITDRTAEKGDMLTIDFTSTIDGKDYDGSSGANYTIMLGIDTMFEEFNESLIGVKAGDVVKVQHTYPTNYYDSDIAGKTADFEVTIVDVQTYSLDNVDLEMINDFGYDTLDDFIKYIKDTLTKSAEEQKEYDEIALILDQILKNSTVKGYNEEELKFYIDDMIKSNKETAESYGLTEVEFIQSNYAAETYEEYEQYVEQYIKEYLEGIMLIYSIAKAENIEVTDEEYLNKIIEYAEEQEIETSEVGKYYTSEDIILMILSDKVQDFLIKNSVNIGK